MINSIKNGDQPLPRVTQVSIVGTSLTEQPSLKDKSMCNKIAKDLWDALARHMLGSEYGEQDRYATMMRQNKNLMNISVDALYNILKQNQGDVNDAMGSKKKTVVKDKDEQLLLAKDQARMESSSDSDQEINANMVFMDQIEKVLSESEASSSSADEKISEALEIEKFKRSRENKIKFAYNYGNQNASYVNEKINFENDYFQEIINPDFEKIDSPF
nr:hypothetical protein [Tanacetum cinerariifolium]